MKRILFLFLLFYSMRMDGQNIKVFESFDDFEKYAFNRDNDTTYIINFWATWCAPCVKELPYFEELALKYETKPFKQILVSLDFKKQIDSRVIPFIMEENIESEVVILADGKANNWIDRVDPTWSGAIPITLIYRGDEKLFYEQEFHSVDELEHELLKLYKQ